MRAWLLLGIACAACGGGPGESRDAGRADGGTMRADGGHDIDAAVTCGTAICAPGESCCDESCGACAAPGRACSCADAGPPRSCTSGAECEAAEYCDFATACEGSGVCRARPATCAPDSTPVCGCDGATHPNACTARLAGTDVDHAGACTSSDPCAPQEATGVGTCATMLGFAWTGLECRAVTGCSCTGASCPDLSASSAECRDGHAACLVVGRCGGSAGDLCDDLHWCDFPDVAACGLEGAEGMCRIRPATCPPGGSPVCGCDEMTYDSDCAAHAAGVDISMAGECPPNPCMAQDAMGVGDCDAFFGFMWDGVVCRPVNGCSCAGADCGSLYPADTDCFVAHAVCGAPTCTLTLLCPDGEWCDYYPGGECGRSPGDCRPRPVSCAGMPEEHVCGCDGVTYANFCEAQRAGTDVAYFTDCMAMISCMFDEDCPAAAPSCCACTRHCFDPVTSACICP